jgi:hypothetical protein
MLNGNRVDDSVHVMLKQSAKISGPQHYVPRAPHPLLQPSCTNTVTSEEDCMEISRALDTETSAPFSIVDEKQARLEEENLLWHAKHHNDTIDSRDILVGAAVEQRHRG